MIPTFGARYFKRRLVLACSGVLKAERRRETFLFSASILKVSLPAPRTNRASYKRSSKPKLAASLIREGASAGVRLQGRVISVTTSPLLTTFINFGGEYPNQTFAGYIAAGSTMTADQRLTMIQGKTIGITGVIRLRDWKPEIEIVSQDQIKALDSQTER